METEARQSAVPGLEIRKAAGDQLTVELRGDWTATQAKKASTAVVAHQLSQDVSLRRVSFDLRQLGDWDTSLLAWLMELAVYCDSLKIEFDRDSLPDGIRDTLELALEVPERTEATRRGKKKNFLERLGGKTLCFWSSMTSISEFVGECVLSFLNLLRGRVQFRRSDFMVHIQEAGAEALGISLMISFLVGLILAFVGAVQLQQFGASIYVANLVAIAMVREMGCIMTGIIMCGRTGASYAAQLGTMKVNQEIDAYRTFLFSPIDFLVLPRMLALFLMMPLLTVFANLAGIVGGGLIGLFMLDITFLDYWNQTVNSLTWAHCSAGFIKSFVFGLIVAITGCYNGMRCENNAAGVGQATTTAVVSGITSIIIADAVFAVLFNIFGI